MKTKHADCPITLTLYHIHLLTEEKNHSFLNIICGKKNPHVKASLMFPPELQLNKANIKDTEAPSLDKRLSISNGFVSSNIYDKRDDFDLI